MASLVTVFVHPSVYSSLTSGSQEATSYDFTQLFPNAHLWRLSSGLSSIG